MPPQKKKLLKWIKIKKNQPITCFRIQIPQKLYSEEINNYDISYRKIAAAKILY